jgi:hypothetical protein
MALFSHVVKVSPHASAKRQVRLMLRRGSFELATTALGKGSGRIGTGRKTCASGVACVSDSTVRRRNQHGSLHRTRTLTGPMGNQYTAQTVSDNNG